MATIEAIEQHAAKIKAGEHDRVHPGQPVRMSEAASVGDGGWQGDLGFEVIAEVPSTHTVTHRTVVQLVPGNSQGARHCITEGKAVVYLPEGWGEEYDGLAGPVLKCTTDVTVGHPTHGNVTIPKGFIVRCRYQREWDAEQRKERRNAD